MPLGVLGLALGAAMLAACAVAPVAPGQAGAAPPTPRPAASGGTLLEVRASGSAGGPGDTTLPADVVDTLRSVAGVTRVEAYLFAAAADGTVVAGIDPLEATLRTPGGQALQAEVIGGRTWVKGDEAEPSAYVGKAYAATHKTMLNLDIAQMISPTHSPPVDLGDGHAVNVRAVVETGSPEGNAQVYVPLAFAQRMLGQAGRVSKVYVTAASPEPGEGGARAIRAALGDAAEVAVAR